MIQSRKKENVDPRVVATAEPQEVGHAYLEKFYQRSTVVP